MASRITRFFTRFTKAPIPRGALTSLSPYAPRKMPPLTPEMRTRAENLKARRDFVQAQREAATLRVERLPSARPEYQGVDNVTAKARSNMPTVKTPETWFAEGRLNNPALIEELEKWEPLASGDPQAAVDTAGAVFKRQTLALAGAVEAAFPASHKARELRPALNALDAQAFFVLEATGFRNRLEDVLGDIETGQISTDTLLNSLFADQTDGSEGSIAWTTIIQELRNATQYNRRRMGRL